MTRRDENRLRRGNVVTRLQNRYLDWQRLTEEFEKPLPQRSFKSESSAQCFTLFGLGRRFLTEQAFAERRSDELIAVQIDRQTR